MKTHSKQCPQSSQNECVSTRADYIKCLFDDAENSKADLQSNGDTADEGQLPSQNTIPNDHGIARHSETLGRAGPS